MKKSNKLKKLWLKTKQYIISALKSGLIGLGKFIKESYLVIRRLVCTAYTSASKCISTSKPRVITYYHALMKQFWIKYDIVLDYLKHYYNIAHPHIALYLEPLYPYYIKAKSYIEFQLAVLHSKAWYQFIHTILFAKTVGESKSSLDEDASNQTVASIIKPYIQLFTYIMAGFCAVFLIWGGIAPLDSATIANGSVKLFGNRKTLQHPTGGVIKSIYVQDGQSVKAGDILMEIDDTTAKAELQRIKNSLLVVKTMKQRVLAQQENLDAINWTGVENEEGALELIRTQNELFNTRVAIYKGNKQLILDQIKMKQENLQSLNARLQAVITAKKTYQEELAGLSKLSQKGLVRKNDLFNMQRSLDNILAEEINSRTELANTLQEIDSLNIKLLNTENEYRTSLSEEYNKVNAELLDYTEQFTEKAYIYDTSTIKAPVDGLVTELAYHTIGGVISPGHKIMDIIPQDDRLIIEAHVETKDIESIRPGLVARVSLNAYKQRIVPRLDGKVIHVAADATYDERGGPPYYIAKVELDENQLAQVNYDVKLYPGMPVTVFVVKGERTFINYLLSPIIDTFHKAFKEQ